ncbi:MAG: tetratricopeptide repeat protein [Thermoanaerobaculales bacterium]|nr:tetratricopeptide repeat protein [Thermoanaerobaculales bacterium]
MLVVRGVIVVGTGFFVCSQWPEKTATVLYEGRSIAVLPFKNLSSEAEQEYFSDGITAEITSKLSRINNLEVVSMTSAARFKGREVDARKIGAELGVRYLLEGSVRKIGNRVRITAQLVLTESGFQLWSDDFEGVLDDVFALQEDTALHIAEALDLRLSEDEQMAVRRRHTVNAQAFDAYLRGRALIEYFSSSEKMEAAEKHFERALKYDPDYALALVGLSRVQAQYYRNLDPSAERLARAEILAARALELDPKLAEAHLAMGQIVANQYRYIEAESLFREAIRLEPRNAYAWDLLSWALAYQQPPDAEAAEKAARTSISLQASLIGAHYHLGRALVLQCRYGEAEAAFLQSKELDPEFEAADFGLAQVYVATGSYTEALEVLDSLEELRKAPVVPFQKAIVYEALGRREEALKALEEALNLGYGDVDSFAKTEQFVDLRADTRFTNLLSRYGLTIP